MIKFSKINKLNTSESGQKIICNLDKIDELYTYDEKQTFILYVCQLEKLFKKHKIDINIQPVSINFKEKGKHCCICQGEFEKNEEVYCCELVKKEMSDVTTINDDFDHYYHKCCYKDMLYSDLDKNPCHNKSCLLCPNKICDTRKMRVYAK